MVLLVSVVVVCIVLGIGNGQVSLDVMNFDAIGDGKTDDTQAFLKAWEAACGGDGPQSLQIPCGKTFLLQQPLTLKGPCKSTPLHFQLEGNIVAPSNPKKWTACSSNRWIKFKDVEGLIINGTGQIDGQGALWWNDASDSKCKERPTSLAFHGCKGFHLKGITLINSPKNHITIRDCMGASITNLNITAPDESPNTDGIDIINSTQVSIFDSFIGTGDDCVAISHGCVDIHIARVTCSPGHGISVGSLGNGEAEETVENVRVQNCTFNTTQNGARIKTWQGGSGYAKNISFEQITLVNVRNPIIIDQNYCPHHHHCPAKRSAVAISDVKFIGFNGTSSDADAITLDCSRATGCNGVVLNQVNITSSVTGRPVRAVCENANVTSTDTVPPVECLS